MNNKIYSKFLFCSNSNFLVVPLLPFQIKRNKKFYILIIKLTPKTVHQSGFRTTRSSKNVFKLVGTIPWDFFLAQFQTSDNITVISIFHNLVSLGYLRTEKRTFFGGAKSIHTIFGQIVYFALFKKNIEHLTIIFKGI